MSNNESDSRKYDSLLTNKEWELIFDAVPDYIAIIDNDFRIKKVNKAMVDFLDLNVENIIGEKCYNLIHYIDEHPSIHSSMLEDLKPHIIKFHEETMNKNLIVSIHPIFDDGKLLGSVHIIHDETEHRKLEASDEKLAAIVKHSNDAIIGKDLNGTIKSWNSGAEKIYGYSADEVKGKNISILMPPEHKDDLPNIIEKIINNEEIINYETVRVTKEGERILVSLTISPINDSNGHIIGASTIARDITEIYKAKKALEKSENKFREVFNNANDAFFLHKIENGLPGKFIDVNKVACERLGYSKEELLQMSPPDINKPDTVDLMPQRMTELMKNGKSTFESYNTAKDGTVIPVEINAEIFDLNGEEVIFSVARDISDRIKTEEALQEREKYLKTIFSAVQTGIVVIDAENEKIVDLNDVAAELIGNPKNEIIGHICHKYICPSEKGKCPIIDLDQTVDNSERVLLDSKGNEIPILKNVVPISLNDREYLIESFIDITKRKTTETKLKISEEKYRRIFDNVQDVFYQTDDDGIIVEISPSIQRYSGYSREELMGKPVEMVYMDPEDRVKLLETIEEKGETTDYEVRLKTKNNKVVYTSTNAHPWLNIDNNPIGIEGSLRDITERKKMEDELRNLLDEKEMLLKEIHHRVKNNLMIISSLLDLQSQDIHDADDLKLFKESQARADSMALIHERLYQSTDLKHINFGEYIQSLANALFNTYVTDPSKIKLNFELEDIDVDINTAIPLGLIVNELITNSMKHGFPEDNSGKIDIKFGKIDDNLCLEVDDDGVGLPDDLDIQNTTTLGLQLVNSLTSQIDGELDLKRDDGTRFKITFKEEKF